MIDIPKDFDINEQCDYIASCISEYDIKQELILLLRANTTMQYLRKNYKKNKESFSPYIERLKELSKKINDKMIASEHELVYSYKEFLNKQKTIKEVCDIYKQALLEVFKIKKYDNVKLADGTISVKQIKKITIPHKNTPDHEQLIDLLHKKGYWEKVVILSAMLLKKAINSEVFTSDCLFR